MIGARLGYTSLLWLMIPWVFWHLASRARRQRGYRQHVSEQFGRYSAAPAKPVIWLHAVSVGETRAAVPLVERLLAAYPDHQILLTHMTPTGRAAGEQLFGNRVLRCYLPYDYPFAVKRFLGHFRPAVGLLMETEIWFNLIHACKRSGVPLLLINARMSQKSAAKYARFGKLARIALEELSAIAAQTRADADRLVALGAPPATAVMGNLKFDLAPPEAMIALGKSLRERVGSARPVFLAASTRPGEEAVILEAVAGAGIPELLTVIVPRHPQRFAEVAGLLQQRGLKFQRRSGGEAVRDDTQVLLGDSMGEMFAYYGACDAAFIGGSLLPFGGQNLIEAAACGKPVLVGPHTFNFDEATRLAIEMGAAQRVGNAEELGGVLRMLMTDSGKRAAMGEAGSRFWERHQGAGGRVMEMLRPFLQPT